MATPPSRRMPTDSLDAALAWLRRREPDGMGRQAKAPESEAALLAFEQRHDLKLEATYRAVLKKHGAVGRLPGEFGELIVCDLTEAERQREALQRWLDESEKSFVGISISKEPRATIRKLRALIPIMYVDAFPSNHTYLQDREGRIFVVDTRHFDGNLERPERKTFEALLLEELAAGMLKDREDEPQEAAVDEIVSSPAITEPWDPMRIKVGSVISGDRFPKWGLEKVATTAPPAADPSAWTVGTRVTHKKFGGGIVMAVDREKLVIAFDSGEKKTLASAFVSREESPQ